MKGVNEISRRCEEQATLVDVVSCELYSFVSRRMQLDVLRNLREQLQVFHVGGEGISLQLQQTLQLKIDSGVTDLRFKPQTLTLGFIPTQPLYASLFV